MQSVKGCVRINVDVLNPAKRDRVQARYNYLLTSLRMRAAGLPGASSHRHSIINAIFDAYIGI